MNFEFLGIPDPKTGTNITRFHSKFKQLVHVGMQFVAGEINVFTSAKIIHIIY